MNKIEVMMYLHEQDEANTLYAFIKSKGLEEEYARWSKGKLEALHKTRNGRAQMLI